MSRKRTLEGDDMSGTGQRQKTDANNASVGHSAPLLVALLALSLSLAACLAVCLAASLTVSLTVSLAVSLAVSLPLRC